jgi:hypothetical protein
MTQESQCSKILRWLATGRSLTTWQAWTKWRITTTSQRVTELKAQRWPIKSEIVKRGDSRVARYWIPEARAAAVRRKLGRVSA